MVDPHALRILEYPQVLERFAAHSHWMPGRERVLAWGPLDETRLIRRRQGEIREMWGLLDHGGLPTPGGLVDPRPALEKAVRGAVLPPLDLLTVKAFASFMGAGLRFYRSHPQAPQLAERVVSVQPVPRVETDIARALAADGTVLDRASPKLAHLRGQVRQLEAHVQDRLQRLVRQPDIARMLQETLVTARQGRWVLPVKASHRTLFPGLFIDQSGTGATVFMEPWDVVEPGNRLRAAQVAEEKEVEAILGRLSGVVAFHAGDLLAGVEAFGAIDAVMAAAEYGRDLGASLPDIGGALVLSEARHPLLVEKLGPSVVPISLHLDDAKTVVVTGPNTGGKTVTLRTIGLLSVLALTGLPIPAGRNSRVPLLKGVYADIGDEQGIAQSLSTFSSHLTQILRILPHAGPATLVLLDEVGAGTDPAEGAALGKALLQWLHDRGTMTVVTTHLSDLKALADAVPGMVNAAVEFDIDTLQPTYRLTMGVAGRSNALSIARRLGLPEDLLTLARRFLGQGSDTVNRLLSDLEEERSATQARDVRLQQEMARLEEERKGLAAVRDAVEGERQSVLSVTRAAGEQAVAAVRTELHEVLKATRLRLADVERRRRATEAEVRWLTVELAAALARDPLALGVLSETAEGRLAQALGDVLERLWVDEAPLAEEPVAVDDLEAEARIEGRTAESRLAELERVLADLAPVRAGRTEVDLSPGQAVYVHSFGQEGTVLKNAAGRVEVQVGSLRLRVRPEEIERL
ncbi:MAG TPA: MutS2/Smr-associated SH3 domain-containing protein [Candidatus Xenobia bacterium]|jgi:DNA mismatch repair protein MutS2